MRFGDRSWHLPQGLPASSWLEGHAVSLQGDVVPELTTGLHEARGPHFGFLGF